MSIIAEFSVRSDDFALNHALTTAPQMVVEIEQVVATMEDRLMPYFWVSGGDLAEFEEAFQDDESVKNTASIDEVEGAKLYRGEWTENVETVIYAYVELGATIIQAIGKAEDWELRMRFDDQDSLSWNFKSTVMRTAFRMNSIQSKNRNSRWRAPSTISHRSNARRWSPRSKQATTRFHER